ncbi:MAG: hypothetical protein JST89_14295 [Cyanobacteria bacterium SZAS-4]|nr:hypothetical protein [Cyanobacteria bacterium SZAS-4]
MIPAFLIRAGVDWVRHNTDYKDSNPYSRCEESIKTCQLLWEQQMGKPDLVLLEPAIVSAYWEEFFHAEDPLPDEKEWREGLTKRSGQYDRFDDWQEWFKKSYAKVYKDNNIWMSVLMTAWAHTHQYEVRYTEDSWEFRPSRSYLPTSQMWRLEPHMQTVAEVLKEVWVDELRAYEESGFTVDEQTSAYLGRVESLGFDSKKYFLNWPPRAQKERQEIEIGDMVADIVLPPGDSWYRHPDNVIFAHDCIDITALVNRAKYVFGSQRRLFELTIDNGAEKAKMQASAEGWLVPEAAEGAVV